MSRERISIIHSLKTQLFLGAFILLALTISLIGYFLIVQQQEALTAELERAVVLQGRNIALSSEKPLLRSDPEFELYPMVTRVLEDVPQVTGVVIVDADGIVQGHRELVQVSRAYEPALSGFTPVHATLLQAGEHLYRNEHAYSFQTPVISAGRVVGNVHLTYSRSDLIAGVNRAIRLTWRLSAVAIGLGLLLSIVFFRHISSAMGVMLEGVDAVASGDLEARIEMPARNEFRVLAGAFNDMSSRMLESQRELVAKERMDRELEIAADIQAALIPSDVTSPAGFEIGHFYQAANEVGGDYVDVIPLEGNRTGLVMADVSGKGVPGLVIMAMVKTMTQQFLTAGLSPCDVLRQLNTALGRTMRKNMFVTMFLGVLDADQKQLTFSNAGHNPLLIFDGAAATARFFRMDGVPLGAFPSDFFDPRARDYQLPLAEGSLVLQYTDGLNESQSAAGRMFGSDRIRDIATLYGKYGARTLIEKLVVEETCFRNGADQFDDLTLLAIGAVARVRESLEEPVAQ